MIRHPRSTLFGRLAWPVLCGCGLVLSLSLCRLRSHVGADFLTFLDGAREFATAPTRLYGPRVLSTMLGFLYPPPSILLFLPFLHVADATAYLIFVGIIYGAAAASLLLWTTIIRRGLDLSAAITRLDWVVLIALGLAAGPVFENAWDGQVNTIVLCLCTFYVALVVAGRPGWAGIVLAAGCWIKLYPALLLFHAWRFADRPKFLAGFAGAGIIIPIVGLPIVPSALYAKYFTQALPILSARLMINISNQSAAAFVTRLHVPIREALQTYHAFAIEPVARLGIAIAALAIIASMIRAAGRSGPDNILVAASIIAMTAPISPLGWGHTYVYILPLLLVGAVMAWTQRAWYSAAGIGSMLMLTSIPPQHVFMSLSALPPWLQDAFYSRDLFATSALLLLAWRLRAVSAIPAGAQAGHLGLGVRSRSTAGGMR